MVNTSSACERERVQPAIVSRWNPYPETIRNTNSTADCSTKSTSATPTAASGRISRGNATFFTRFALEITDWAPAVSDTEKRFHASSPERRQTGKSGMSLPSTLTTNVKTARKTSGFKQRPDRAEHRGRVLDLELLADEVPQDLAEAAELAHTGDHPQSWRFGRAFGELDGGDRGAPSGPARAERAGQSESSKAPRPRREQTMVIV